MLRGPAVNGDKCSVFRDVLNSERIGCEVEVRTVRNVMDYCDLENSQPNEMNGDDNDDDIYGDLESAVFSSTPKKSSSKTRQELEERLKTALIEISELKERVTTLSKENLNLEKNYSTLLKTAKDERSKNTYILKSLQKELKDVTNANKRGTFLSKDEIARIRAYCTEVESSLVSDISYEVVRKALVDAKQKHLEDKREQCKRPWRKQFKFDNFTYYFSQEQVNFSRLEPVTIFPAEKPKETFPPLPAQKTQEELPPPPPPPEKILEKPPPPPLQRKRDSPHNTRRSKTSRQRKPPDSPPRTRRRSDSSRQRKNQSSDSRKSGSPRQRKTDSSRQRNHDPPRQRNHDPPRQRSHDPPRQRKPYKS